MASQWVTALVDDLFGTLDGVAAPFLHRCAVDVLPFVLQAILSVIGHSIHRWSLRQRSSN
jgi:hypothetical protein